MVDSDSEDDNEDDKFEAQNPGLDRRQTNVNYSFKDSLLESEGTPKRQPEIEIDEQSFVSEDY